MSKIAIIIAPNWHNYATKYLSDCIESLRRIETKHDYKIFLPDNESSVESREFIEKIAPEVEIMPSDTNDGFIGNNRAMQKALDNDYDFVYLINMDTVVMPDFLDKAMNVIVSDERIGSVQSRLMLWSNKELINSLGNITHFLGFGYSGSYQEKFVGGDAVKDIFYPSGAAVLFRSSVLKKIGLFDEEFWMYNEDQDIGWRIWLAGYRCVLASKSVVYHKYEFAKSVKQYYWMDRNRIIVMIKNYHILTLFFIFPVFLIMELGLILFSIKGNWFKEKVRVWKYFISYKNWKYLLQARRKTQSLRKIKDREIAKMISGKIWYQEIDDIKLRLINPVFNSYWKILRFFMFW